MQQSAVAIFHNKPNLRLNTEALLPRIASRASPSGHLTQSPPVDLATSSDRTHLTPCPCCSAITVHEAAHGYTARHFGDNTATMMGRVAQPIKHIDPVGTVLMPLVLYFATSGAFLFGYAKPVPVNFHHLRNPKRDMVWVALAGPASTLPRPLAGHCCWCCWRPWAGRSASLSRWPAPALP